MNLDNTGGESRSYPSDVNNNMPGCRNANEDAMSSCPIPSLVSTRRASRSQESLHSISSCSSFKTCLGTDEETNQRTSRKDMMSTRGGASSRSSSAHLPTPGVGRRTRSSSANYGDGSNSSSSPSSTNGADSRTAPRLPRRDEMHQRHRHNRRRSDVGTYFPNMYISQDMSPQLIPFGTTNDNWHGSRGRGTFQRWNGWNDSSQRKYGYNNNNNNNNNNTHNDNGRRRGRRNEFDPPRNSTRSAGNSGNGNGNGNGNARSNIHFSYQTRGANSNRQSYRYSGNRNQARNTIGQYNESTNPDSTFPIPNQASAPPPFRSSNSHRLSRSDYDYSRVHPNENVTRNETSAATFNNGDGNRTVRFSTIQDGNQDRPHNPEPTVLASKSSTNNLPQSTPSGKTSAILLKTQEREETRRVFDNDIADEMARALETALPVRLNNERNSRLNPRAEPFHQHIHDSSGRQYEMTTNSGTSYFRPMEPNSRPDPNYVINTFEDAQGDDRSIDSTSSNSLNSNSRSRNSSNNQNLETQTSVSTGQYNLSIPPPPIPLNNANVNRTNSRSSFNQPMGNQPLSNQPLSNPPMRNQQLRNQPMGNQQLSNQQLSNQQLSNRPMGNVPMSNGPMGNGPMGNGPISNGPMGNGPMGNGPISNGPMGNGPMGNGPMGNGPISNRTMGNRPEVNVYPQPVHVAPSLPVMSQIASPYASSMQIYPNAHFLYPHTDQNQTHFSAVNQYQSSPGAQPLMHREHAVQGADEMVGHSPQMVTNGQYINTPTVSNIPSYFQGHFPQPALIASPVTPLAPANSMNDQNGNLTTPNTPQHFTFDHSPMLYPLTVNYQAFNAENGQLVYPIDCTTPLHFEPEKKEKMCTVDNLKDEELVKEMEQVISKVVKIVTRCHMSPTPPSQQEIVDAILKRKKCPIFALTNQSDSEFEIDTNDGIRLDGNGNEADATNPSKETDEDLDKSSEDGVS